MSIEKLHESMIEGSNKSVRWVDEAYERLNESCRQSIENISRLGDSFVLGESAYENLVKSINESVDATAMLAEE